MLTIRKSDDRGQANHGWLKSFHTFSFADYYDPKHMHFGPLRVINEDFIAGEKGFGTHPHKDMEIFTYVISGALEHKDSMGNSSVILPGEVQIMSAGTGVLHSEYSKTNEETHLFQIWILPDKSGIKPRYAQKSFADKFTKSNLVLILSPDEREESILIHQNADIYAGKFKEDQDINFKIKNKKAWIQLISGKLKINDNLTLEAGDGLAVTSEGSIQIKAAKESHFLLFDLE